MRGHRTRVPLLATSAALLLAAALIGPAAAHPQQHDSDGNHLFGTGAAGDLDLVSKLWLADEPGTVADVAVSPDGDHAYLAHWGRSTCAENSEAGGKTDPDAGAWVVDISDIDHPVEVGFIPHHQDSRPGEGMQVLEVDTRSFTGDMLVMNSEQCGKNGKGGVVLWDVTDPAQPKQLAAHAGDPGFADTNDTHSAFAWDAGEHAYLVMVDNFESTDVDILDITNPKRPRLVAEYNLNTYVEDGVSQPTLGLQESSLHDMTVKLIEGRWMMLLSYWDGGYVLMDVTDPTDARYVYDTEYAAIDPELFEATGKALPPEGNGHQAEFTADDRFFIATDEDFSPYRSIFTIDTGPAAGEYPAGEFGFTPPVQTTLADGKLNGPTVFGGYGCPGDRAGIPPRSSALPGALAAGEEAIIVFERGPVGDPDASGEACFFSEKIESGQLAGYDAVVIANHHGGAQAGAAADSHFCGGQGHVYDKTAPAVCIGHRAMHLLFGSEPNYTYPEATPAVGAVGEKASFTPSYDGWGYVHLFDAETGAGLDTYAIPEAHDESYAFGFGDLTVHEVATHPTDPSVAYLSYYAGGMRQLEIQCTDPGDTSTCALVETGSYLDPGGNDFWGVEVFVRDGSTYVLGSDRDSGLWIFEDTARHSDDHEH
ncbi:MAG: hypothetical protein KY461_02320 [Actinobacteria bacterium]|nr:hypothetical protein [Actinomycetota bacterium]